jgi:hypothetical protein
METPPMSRANPLQRDATLNAIGSPDPVRPPGIIAITMIVASSSELGISGDHLDESSAKATRRDRTRQSHRCVAAAQRHTTTANHCSHQKAQRT